MSALKIAAGLVAVYWIYNAFKIARNYIKARECGLPIYITPVDMTDPLWAIWHKIVLPIAERLFPASVWRTLDLSTYGFEFRDSVAGRTRPPCYFLVGPGKLDLFVADPGLLNTILSKKKQFPTDEVVMKIMGPVGSNLLASEGEDWQRQRRLIAPMLNERIMDTVWEESQRQAGDMMHSFMEEGGTTNGTVEGLRRVAFNLLQCIGYGHTQGWGEKSPDIPRGRHMNYMEALHELINGFILIAIVPHRILTLPFLPNIIKKKGYALQDFLSYTQELLANERAASAESSKPRNNMLSLLSTISQRSTKDESHGAPSVQSGTLSDDEVTGNLYIFTLAGYDTTANTLAYTATTLATLPEWQDWIIEEIDQVKKEVGEKAGYAEIFPKLERCLALMVQTLFCPRSGTVTDKA